MPAWLQSLVAWLRPARVAMRPAAAAGLDGERRAAAWLTRERNFRILAHNWRSPRDRRHELDLVAHDGDVLVFIEVKSRPNDALVPGYFAAVHPRKKKALLRAAKDYIGRLRTKPRTVRYDVVEIATGLDAREPEVRHYENVPLFTKEFLRGR